MKKIILIILVAAAAFPFQNCKPTTEDPPVIIDTTTKPPVTKPKPVNGFWINGVEKYSMAWDSGTMYGWYKKNQDLTEVIITGMDNTKEGEIYLTFPGKGKGTFKHSLQPGDVIIKLVTKEKPAIPASYKMYQLHTDPGSDMIITVTQYDPVEGRIKGTFSGKLQESTSITTATVDHGTFEVKRMDDE